MSTLTARVAARFQKRADSFDGPNVWGDDHYIQVWIGMDSYGRVHHVVGDLEGADKLLHKHRQILVHAQQELAAKGVLFRDIGDTYVDGLKGGRNRMMLSFTVTPQGGWGPEGMDAVLEYLPHLKFKKPA